MVLGSSETPSEDSLAPRRGERMGEEARVPNQTKHVARAVNPELNSMFESQPNCTSSSLALADGRRGPRWVIPRWAASLLRRR